MFMSDFPYAPPQASFEKPASYASPTTQGSVRPLIDASFWMKLVGVAAIVYGAIVCLSLVGIIIGWLPIWIGVLYWQAGSIYQQLEQRPDPNAESVAHGKLGLALKIQGILVLIALVIMCLYFLVLFLIVGIGLMGALR